ncbi:hypothetical protein OAO01_09220, partial [Oligoflexia bacterium]|nr:hypothetical protein [Oligoflexia bacterium]
MPKIRLLILNGTVAICFLATISLSSNAFAAGKQRKRGRLVVLTKKATGKALAGVSFSIDGKAYATNLKGKKLLKLKPKRYTIQFETKAGFTLQTPADGLKTTRVRKRRKKKVRAVYEKQFSQPEEICTSPVGLVDVSSPDQVVGDGTAASCTEAALSSAIAQGGTTTFNCGTAPVTISLSSEKKITKDTILDGGGLVTLSGAGKTRILSMDTGNFESTTPHLTVQRLTFTGGKAKGTAVRLGTDVDGGGGAIYYYGGSVTAIDCIFSENGAAELGPDVGGGAIYGVGVGTTTVVGCQIDGNRASNGGAIGALHTGLAIYNSTITNNVATGHGANYQDDQNKQQGHGGNGGALVMDGNGRTLSICGTTIQGNSAGALGGALFRTGYESEPSIIDRCTIDSNTVRDSSDADLPNGAGALYIQGTTVSLSSSTVSNNSSRAFAGVWILGHGASAPAVANLTNVTIMGNATHPRDDFTKRGIGAGVIIGSDTTGTLSNCTIYSNQAQFGSGIINASPLTIKNSIIANHADNEWTPLNCTGSNNSTVPGLGQNNLQWPNGKQSDMDCVNGITRADPLMGTLADNGGVTETVAPLSNSPALAAGNDCEATDQRGVARAEPCTLGAYEV